MQYPANTAYRIDRRIAFQRKMEKAAEWSRKPMTARAECAIAAAAGTITFLLFVIASGILF